MRVFRTILGMLLLTVGLPALLAGAALWAAMQHRDQGGAFSADLQRLSTPGYAVVVDDVDRLLRTDVPFARIADTQVRLAGSTAGGPAFIGLAPTAQAQQYLAGVPHSTVRSVDIGTGALPVATVPVTGGHAPSSPPDQARFWTRMSTDGALAWSPGAVRGGPYSLVVMNPGATPGVQLTTVAELRPGWLNSSTWGLLTLGTLLVMVGLIVLAWPSRRREVVYVVEPSQVPDLMQAIGAPLPINRSGGAHRPPKTAGVRRKQLVSAGAPSGGALPEVADATVPPGTADMVTALPGAADAVPVSPGAADRVGVVPGTADAVSGSPGAADSITALPGAAGAVTGSTAFDAVLPVTGTPISTPPTAAEYAAATAIPKAGIRPAGDHIPLPGQPLNLIGAETVLPVGEAAPAAESALGRRFDRGVRRPAQGPNDIPEFQASAVGAWVAETAAARARETEAQAAARMAEAARNRAGQSGSPAPTASPVAGAAGAQPGRPGSASPGATGSPVAGAQIADTQAGGAQAGGADARAAETSMADNPLADAPVATRPEPAELSGAEAAYVAGARDVQAEAGSAAQRPVPAELPSTAEAAYAAGAADARAARGEFGAAAEGVGVGAPNWPPSAAERDAAMAHHARMANQRVAVVTGPRATDWSATGLTRADSPRPAPAGGPATGSDRPNSLTGPGSFAGPGAVAGPRAHAGPSAVAGPSAYTGPSAYAGPSGPATGGQQPGRPSPGPGAQPGRPSPGPAGQSPTPGGRAGRPSPGPGSPAGKRPSPFGAAGSVDQTGRRPSPAGESMPGGQNVGQDPPADNAEPDNPAGRPVTLADSRPAAGSAPVAQASPSAASAPSPSSPLSAATTSESVPTVPGPVPTSATGSGEAASAGTSGPAATAGQPGSRPMSSPTIRPPAPGTPRPAAPGSASAPVPADTTAADRTGRDEGAGGAVTTPMDAASGKTSAAIAEDVTNTERGDAGAGSRAEWAAADADTGRGKSVTNAEPDVAQPGTMWAARNVKSGPVPSDTDADDDSRLLSGTAALPTPVTERPSHAGTTTDSSDPAMTSGEDPAMASGDQQRAETARTPHPGAPGSGPASGDGTPGASGAAASTAPAPPRPAPPRPGPPSRPVVPSPARPSAPTQPSRPEPAPAGASAAGGGSVSAARSASAPGTGSGSSGGAGSASTARSGSASETGFAPVSRSASAGGAGPASVARSGAAVSAGSVSAARSGSAGEAGSLSAARSGPAAGGGSVSAARDAEVGSASTFAAGGEFAGTAPEAERVPGAHDDGSPADPTSAMKMGALVTGISPVSVRASASTPTAARGDLATQPGSGGPPAQNGPVKNPPIPGTPLAGISVAPAMTADGRLAQRPMPAPSEERPSSEDLSVEHAANESGSREPDPADGHHTRPDDGTGRPAEPGGTGNQGAGRLYAQAQSRVDGGVAVGSAGRLAGLGPGRPAPAAWRKAAETVAARAAAAAQAKNGSASPDPGAATDPADGAGPAVPESDAPTAKTTRTVRARAAAKTAKPKVESTVPEPGAKPAAKSAARTKPAAKSAPAKPTAKPDAAAKPGKAAKPETTGGLLSTYRAEAAELLASTAPRRRRRGPADATPETPRDTPGTPDASGTAPGMPDASGAAPGMPHASGTAPGSPDASGTAPGSPDEASRRRRPIPPTGD